METLDFLSTLLGGGALGVLLKFALDNRMEKIAAIRLQKREIYSDSVHSLRVFLSGGGHSDSLGHQFLRDYSKVWLWASDEVLRDLRDFLTMNRRVAAGEQITGMEQQQTFQNCMISLRRDLRHTDLEAEDFSLVSIDALDSPGMDSSS